MKTEENVRFLVEFYKYSSVVPPPHVSFRHVDSLRQGPVCNGNAPCTLALFTMRYKVKSGDKTPIPGTAEIEDYMVSQVESRCLGLLLALFIAQLCYLTLCVAFQRTVLIY